MIPLEATLGVPGLPQSATGQTALLTGVNAARELGHHKQGFPNAQLRHILRQGSVLKMVREMGKSAAFINAFRPAFFAFRTEDIISRLSVTTVANWAAGLPFFSLEDILGGRAIYQDFTNRDLIDRGFTMPVYTPRQAGRIFAGCAERYDFVLYEYFRTDHAGHAQNMAQAGDELRKLDLFLQTVLSCLDLERTLLVVTSDHGNIEDLSVRTHTMNRVPALLWGRGAGHFADGCQSIVDVVPLIRRALQERAPFEDPVPVENLKLAFSRGKEVIPCQ